MEQHQVENNRMLYYKMASPWTSLSNLDIEVRQAHKQGFFGNPSCRGKICQLLYTIKVPEFVNFTRKKYVKIATFLVKN